jgi:formylglycine-generating enzyme required for sulfatase activity
MVTIPAGPFLMGTDPREVRQLGRTAHGNRMEWYAREQPLHTLTLPAYQIGRYPVTVGEFAAFVEAGGYLDSAFWSESGWRWREQNRITRPEYWSDPDWSDDPNMPVAGVSWHAAAAYCRWLSLVSGGAYRLPTSRNGRKRHGARRTALSLGQSLEPAYANTAPETVYSWDTPDPAPRRPAPRRSASSPPWGTARSAARTWPGTSGMVRFSPAPLPARLDQPPIPDDHEPQIVRAAPGTTAG